MPAVSIIMPAYNASQTISASIASILAQTHQDWELIVVNDQSTDNTVEIIQNFTDSRIKLHSNPKNSGTAKTRNHAMAQAQGKWLAFLDSDDTWHPEKLATQLKFAEETEAKITYTATAYVNAQGQKSPYVLSAKKHFTYPDLLRRNLMSCSSVMVLRDIMEPFPSGYMHEDYVVWLRILKKVGTAYGLNQPMLIYRMAQGTKSAGRINSMKMTYAAYKMVGYGKIASVFLTARYAWHSIAKRARIRFE